MQKYNFLGSFGSKLLISSYLLFTSCNSGTFNVDIDDIDFKIQVNRLDKDLFDKQTASIDSLNRKLSFKYNSFYKVYLQEILNIGSPSDPMISVLLNKFRKDEIWIETQNEINTIYPNFDSEQLEIEEALKRYKFFFPNTTLPNLVTYNSGFNIGIYPSDSLIGIGLEWYLGADNKIVKQLATDDFPQYMKNQMNKENLVPSSLKGWLLYKHQNNFKNENLLDVMIYYGKILFILKTILPKHTEVEIVSYTNEQLLWCKNNEFSFWTYLVDNKLLFTKNYKDISRFINDAPFTSGISQESAPRTGVWLGYEMVKQYVDKKEIKSLQELLKANNSQEFLKYYKPAK
jgi:hypothetical protein